MRVGFTTELLHSSFIDSFFYKSIISLETIYEFNFIFREILSHSPENSLSSVRDVLSNKMNNKIYYNESVVKSIVSHYNKLFSISLKFNHQNGLLSNWSKKANEDCQQNITYYILPINIINKYQDHQIQEIFKQFRSQNIIPEYEGELQFLPFEI